MNTQVPTKMLTVKEIAKRRNTSERSVRRAIADERLPAHRIGRALRISEADADLFLELNRTIGRK